MPNSSAAYPTDIRIASDGKIVVTGRNTAATLDEVLVRYGTNGALDTTFSTDGIVTLDLGGMDVSGEVVLDSTKRPIIAATTQSGGIFSMTVVRYTTTGTIDTSFGSSGEVFITFPSYTSSFGYSIAIDSSSRFVVGGSAANTTGGHVMAVARLSSSGTLDTTFDTDGKQTTAVLSNADGADLRIASDGKIVQSGAANQSGGLNQMAIVRYTSSGALDTTFGTSGKVTTSYSPFNGVAYRLALDSDKPVLGGARY